jgi:ribonuclease HI
MEVYTDGASNKKGSGWAVVAPQKQAIFRGDLSFGATNQQAELGAIVQAIHNLGQEITIYTDSQYSIGCFTKWWQNWMKNGWKNSQRKPVKNEQLIKLGLSLGANKVKYIHVNGHSGDRYNDMADYYAKNDQLKLDHSTWTLTTI